MADVRSSVEAIVSSGSGAVAPFTAAELRLRRHAEFQRVYNATRKQHGKQMSFFAARREVLPGEYAGPRVGLTVGKVMGKAHVRNRIKRRLREAVRAEHAALRGLPVDVVLHPRRTVETVPLPQLRAEVAEVFRRASRSAGQRPGDAAAPSAGPRGPELGATEPRGPKTRESKQRALNPGPEEPAGGGAGSSETRLVGTAPLGNELVGNGAA